MTFSKRTAGILLPIFSLPSPYGIGSLGEAAYRFVDFLRDAGQHCWQVLPLSPTSFGDSPYQSPSAYAGNPNFIDLDLLCKDGLLTQADLTLFARENQSYTDYGDLYLTRPVAFRKAFAAFSGGKEFEDFKNAHAEWLNDYCLFAALKNECPERLWQNFDEGIKYRDSSVLADFCTLYRKEIEYHAFLQYEFYKQWDALKAYANKHGIKIIGDIPIYVAADSADVWANPGLFELDIELKPVRVAGCPPDAYCADGQLWGNPLYDWEAHAETGYKWWLMRLGHNLKLFDYLRIDHFRGFESYYAIPAKDSTAQNGVWVTGPGKAFIRVINEWFAYPPIIAENLGFLTPAVAELLNFSGYPGMGVLQFAFSKSDGKSEHLPHNYTHNSAVYTGTHDNNTSRGFFKKATRIEKSNAKAYFGIKSESDAALAFVRGVLNSTANLAMVPLADYLNLDSSARLNTPSVLGGNNWRWRIGRSDLTEKLSKSIKKLTELSGRN